MSLNQIRNFILTNIISKIIITFLIPALITLLVGPYLNLYNYKGLIKKDGIIKGDSTIVYSIVSTSPSMENIRFCFQITDTVNFALATKRMALDKVPTNTTFLYTGQKVIGRSSNPNYERCILVNSIHKGEYELKVNLNKKQITEKKPNSGSSFLLTIDRYNQINSFSPIEVEEYKWYHIIYFYPFWTSLILFLILLLITYLIKLKSRKSKTVNNQKTKPPKMSVKKTFLLISIFTLPFKDTQKGKIDFIISDGVSGKPLVDVSIFEKGNVIGYTDNNGHTVIEKDPGIFYFDFRKNFYEEISDYNVQVSSGATKTEYIKMFHVKALKLKLDSLVSLHGKKDTTSILALYIRIMNVYLRSGNKSLIDTAHKRLELAIDPLIKKKTAKDMF